MLLYSGECHGIPGWFFVRRFIKENPEEKIRFPCPAITLNLKYSRS
jgi:hypothetical protein